MRPAKVILPDKLTQLTTARASERGCKNLDEYLQLLIREDVPSPIDAQLETELLKSLKSPARKATAQYWADKRRKLLR